MSLKSIAEKVKAMFSEENKPETNKTEPVKNEAPETKNETEKETEKEIPAPAAPDFEKRFADIEAAILEIGNKIIEKKEDPVIAEAMSAIKEMKSEFASVKADVVKLNAAPAGDIAGADKKKAVTPKPMSKTAESILARINHK